METRAVLTARIEHADLYALLDRMSRLARHPGGRPGPGAFREVDEIVVRLRESLLDHCSREEATAYQDLEGTAGRNVTGLLLADHRAISRKIARLAAARAVVAEDGPSKGNVEDLRMQLYGLVDVVDDHFRREELAYSGLG